MKIFQAQNNLSCKYLNNLIRYFQIIFSIAIYQIHKVSILNKIKIDKHDSAILSNSIHFKNEWMV